jgi:hypothetical protein
MQENDDFRSSMHIYKDNKNNPVGNKQIAVIKV